MDWKKPLYNEDYDKLYGITDYKNKTVLDIGADYGSTAYFFIQKGASKVIAVEGNPKLFKQLLNNTRYNNKVIQLPIFITSTIHITQLLKIYKPDITKIDIEGWEFVVSQVKPNTLQLCKEYIIEVHNTNLYNKINTTLTKSQFTLKHIYIYKTEKYKEIRVCLWKL